VSEDKEMRSEPEEQKDVEGHMRGRIDEADEMRGMRGENDEDVEGHMRARTDEGDEMRGMKGQNDEDDDVEGHMRGQITPQNTP